MQVTFESRNPDARALREPTVERLRFVLRRLTWLVPRAHVQLVDINGPRGGLDKQCRLSLHTDGHGEIVITTVAHDWRSAVNRSLGRAARSLVRLWRRKQRRTHPPLAAL